MAYTINLTDGSIFATIADGTINTSSSMTLIGKNYAGYGEFLDENFIHLLENGSNTTAPGAPLTGQLWWDKTNSLLKVYNGSVFKTISAATSSASAPASNVTGDLWYDTTNQQLKVWTGSAWLLVGPSFTAGTGTTGAIVDTIIDNTLVSHVVIKLYVSDSVVGIVSKDAAFTPQTAIPGFTQVKPGITLASLVGSQVPLFQGTSTDSQMLDGLDSTSFMRTDTNTSTTGTVGVLSDNGLTVGADSDFKVSISTVNVTVQNQTQDGNVIFRVNDGGVTTTVMNLDGANSLVGVTGIYNLGSNATGNIGSASSYFNTVFAKATSAQYADVAERFAADEVLEPGTVVELGGSHEITKSVLPLSENVFGVISTRAAYLMNSAAGDDTTHPPVAMTGRVPVRVVGTVNKGDRLVSAGNGIARAAVRGEATAFNTIGRALESKTTTEEGVVEAIVTIK